jgi:hypothetical protein
LGGLLLLAVASSAVAWWLIGDYGRPIDDDFIFRWEFGNRHAAIIGVVGLLMGACAAVPLVKATDSDGRRASFPIVMAALAGIAAGGGLRVVTARVAGANIGGGFVILVGPFVVLGLLVAALTSATAFVRCEQTH